MDDREKRAKEIFNWARTYPFGKWGWYLDRQCGGDQLLRERVEELLKKNGPTKRGEPERVAQIEGDYKVGDQVDKFTIKEILGEGGMGMVYLAEQIKPVRRLVALKVIKPGIDTKATLKRFRNERQALAIMNHPGIAGVLDAGSTERGRPWFAMEYIPGAELTKYCDSKLMPVRERLVLFANICDAIEHAHLKQIVHRDLKPSNILVTEDENGLAQSKIIDFGIAKAMDASIRDVTINTSIGGLVGTFGYMSPEQLEGGHDIDTRVDIYALGIVLYELLTGQLPFVSKAGNMADAEHEYRQLIRTKSPQVPDAKLSSTDVKLADEIAARRSSSLVQLKKTLKGEIGWVVLKSLRKKRDDRYASAREFAADIRNYLNNQPVEAAPESRTYRTRKFLRRHKIATSVAAGFLLLLMASSIVLLYLLRAAEASEIRANETAMEAEKQKAAADEMSDFMLKIIGGVDQNIAQGKDTELLELIIDQAEDKLAESRLDEEGRARVINALNEAKGMLGTESNLAIDASLESGIRSVWTAIEQGKYKEARGRLESLESKAHADPNDPAPEVLQDEILLADARLMLEDGRPDDAQEITNTLISKIYEDADIDQIDDRRRRIHGLSLLYQGRTKESEVWLVSSEPPRDANQDSAKRYAGGLYLLANSQFEAADKEFKLAADAAVKDSDKLRAQQGRIQCLLLNSRYEEAGQQLDQIEASWKDDSENEDKRFTAYLRGEWQLRHGDPDVCGDVLLKAKSTGHPIESRAALLYLDWRIRFQHRSLETTTLADIRDTQDRLNEHVSKSASKENTHNSYAESMNKYLEFMETYEDSVSTLGQGLRPGTANTNKAHDFKIWVYRESGEFAHADHFYAKELLAYCLIQSGDFSLADDLIDEMRDAYTSMETDRSNGYDIDIDLVDAHMKFIRKQYKASSNLYVEALNKMKAIYRIDHPRFVRARDELIQMHETWKQNKPNDTVDIRQILGRVIFPYEQKLTAP